MPERSVPRRLPFLLAALPLLGWWLYGLFDLDEGFYGAVAAEMLRRGDWITPWLNGEPWFEKPIAVYWMAIPFLALFGENVGPRLPGVLAALGTYAMVYRFAKARLNLGAAQLAVVILGTSLLFVALSRMLMTDPWLVLGLTAALLAFWESLVGNPRWRLVAAAALGFSVLAKGPVGCALFVAIAGITYWRQPTLRPAFKGYWLAGTGLFLAVVASWYLPAYLKHGDLFVQKFLIEQNVNRFLGGDEAHTIRGFLNWIYYVPILLLGMAPWSWRLWQAWLRREPTQGEGPDLAAYLSTWAWTIFVFFTLSGAKLVHYIAPMLAPLALLVGAFLATRRRWEDGVPAKGWVLPTVWAVSLAAIVNVGFVAYYRSFHAEIHALTRWVRAEATPSDTIAEYRMSRQSADKGTGRPEIQETSHPSILFYLNRTVVDTDDLAELVDKPKPVWILTRKGRVKPADQSALADQGFDLVEVDSPVAERYYRVWKITPRNP